MTFEVPLGTVDAGRHRSPGRFLAIGLGAVVGLAILTSQLAPPAAPRVASDRAPSPPQPAVAAGVGQGGEAPAVRAPRPVPPLDCTSLDPVSCRRIAAAAIAAIPDDAPAVDRATVWASLLCNDDLDCPGRYLGDGVPLGSVIVVFADGGPSAAVNVVDWRPEPGIRLGPRAWLARWLPASGSG